MQLLSNLDAFTWTTIFICNPHVSGTNIEAQCDPIFCESRFWVILICPRVILFPYVIIMCWVQTLRPSVIVFPRIHILSNRDLSPWDIIYICNQYVLGKIMQAQCNLIFRGSRCWVLLICPHGISFSYVTGMFRVQIVCPA